MKIKTNRNNRTLGVRKNNTKKMVKTKMIKKRKSAKTFRRGIKMRGGNSVSSFLTNPFNTSTEIQGVNRMNLNSNVE